MRWRRARVPACWCGSSSHEIILDSASADDIGKLPDHNTAAALRRIPGVSVQEDQGEYRWPIIRGLEASVQQTFVFLPVPFDTLGASVNGTLLDTEFRTPTATGTRMTGYVSQPDRTANATLFYARAGIDLRFSWNFIGKFLGSIAATAATDQHWQYREQFDFHASYRFAQRYTVFFEAENLTERGRRELIGPQADRLQEHARYGRVLWLGLTAKF